MKKLLLTLGLAALTLASSHAQGTLNPINGPTSRVRFDLNCNGVYESTDRGVTAADGLHVGVFIGAAGQDATAMVGELTLGSAGDGLMVGLPTLWAPDLAGLNTAAGAQISLRFRAIGNYSGLGDTGSKTITLAPAAGPGTVVWGSTATASRFGPLIIFCPEPSTLALGALAGALLLFRVRKTIPRR